MKTEQVLRILNEKISFSLSQENDIGLANGQMGHCLYFYILSRKEKCLEYQSIADSLLNSVYGNIYKLSSVDLKTGLAGIGLGITYLVKHNYIQGKLNNTVQDIDNVIFKKLSSSTFMEQSDFSILMHLVYYIHIRLKEQKKGSENEYILKEIMIETINHLYKMINSFSFKESLIYTTDYELPQFLYLLSVIYEQNIYNYKLEKIIEEISYSTLNTIPIMHANRLYLLWGISMLNAVIPEKKWKKHLLLLRDNINVHYILSQEVQGKNIFFRTGLTSIYWLLSALKDYFSPREIKNHQSDIRNRILSSDMWDLLLNNETHFANSKGLYNGFCSIPLIIKLN